MFIRKNFFFFILAIFVAVCNAAPEMGKEDPGQVQESSSEMPTGETEKAPEDMQNIDASNADDGSSSAGDECKSPPTLTRQAKECCEIEHRKFWESFMSSYVKCGRKMGLSRSNFLPHLRGVLPLALTTPTAKPEESDESDESDESGESEEIIAATTTSPAIIGNKEKLMLGGLVQDGLSQALHMAIQIMRGSLSMLTEKYRRWSDKECFMECVFEEEQLIKDGKLNNESIENKFHDMIKDQGWVNVTAQAVQVCLEQKLEIPDHTECRSGANEIFKCIFKELFYNCPSWPVKNEYCQSLKEFHDKCPKVPINVGHFHPHHLTREE